MTDPGRLRRVFIPLLLGLVWCLAPLGSPSAAPGQVAKTADAPPDSGVATILAMEKRYQTALMARDTKPYVDLLAKDFLYLGPGKKTTDKAALSEPFTETKWRNKQYVPWNVRVRMFGSVAVVTFRLDRVWAGPDGDHTRSFAVTRVWSQSDGAWRVSSSQLTEIPPTREFKEYADPPDTTASPPPPSLEGEAVLTLEESFKTGFLTRDEKTVSNLVSDDFVHIGLEGEIVNKKTYMDFFTRGDWRFEKYEPWDVRVRTYGSAVIVTGRVERILVANEQRDMGAFAFTHVWHHSSGAWRIVSSHVTLVPPSPVD